MITILIWALAIIVIILLAIAAFLAFFFWGFYRWGLPVNDLWRRAFFHVLRKEHPAKNITVSTDYGRRAFTIVKNGDSIIVELDEYIPAEWNEMTRQYLNRFSLGRKGPKYIFDREGFGNFAVSLIDKAKQKDRYLRFRYWGRWFRIENPD